MLLALNKQYTEPMSSIAENSDRVYEMIIDDAREIKHNKFAVQIKTARLRAHAPNMTQTTASFARKLHQKKIQRIHHISSPTPTDKLEALSEVNEAGKTQFRSSGWGLNTLSASS